MQATFASGAILASQAAPGLARYANTATRFVQTAGVRGYNVLRGAVIALKDSGVIQRAERLEVHHLIERRFASLFNVKSGDMLSIVLRPEEHQVFTNLWRQYIPYGTNVATLSKERVIEVARTIYANYPEILKALSIQ